MRKKRTFKETPHKGTKRNILPGKVDLVFLAEGYTADEQEKFVADAKRFTEALFKTPPYDTRREDLDRKSTRLNSSHRSLSRMPSSA